MATDHFKRALELARRQGKKSASEQARNVIHRINDPIGLKSQYTDDFQHLEYTHTQIQTISEQHLRDNRVIAGFPDDPNSSPFRILRTQLMQELRQHELNSIAITAAHSGAGKSLVAANLAVSLSLMTNITVLLVDLDLRNPSIHHYFDIDVKYGLYDYLTDAIPLKNILVNPGIDRLVVLPGSKPTSGSSELLATKEALNLIDEICSRYASRIILFDLPPLIGLDDALVVLPKIDASIFVVEANKTTEAELQQSMQILEDHHLLGTVFNKADQLDIRHYGY